MSKMQWNYEGGRFSCCGSQICFKRFLAPCLFHLHSLRRTPCWFILLVRSMPLKNMTVISRGKIITINDWIFIWNRESARLVLTCAQENSQYIGSSVTPILLIIFLFFLYSVHNDNLYCERHYAENLKPRCGACDELIFDGQYTKVSVSVSFRFRLIEFEILRENEHNFLPKKIAIYPLSLKSEIDVYECCIFWFILWKKSFVTYLLLPLA